MLRTILKIPFNYLGRFLNFPFVLPISIAFAVTYRCNSRCKTCNIWKYPSNEEMNLNEINRLFRSLGNSFSWITLSGGEPFLRDDLTEICRIIYSNCHPYFINIATNGSLPDRVITCVKKILKDCPKTKLTINLSIDGIGENHDNTRGLPGNFDSFKKTYHGLKSLKTNRLRLGLYTILSDYNISGWEGIFAFGKELSPDSHFFEIAQIRDEFKNQGLNQFMSSKGQGIEFFKKLYSFKNTDKNGVGEYLIHALRISYYSVVSKTIFLNRQIIPCFAAFATCYILPDGKVWACSNRERIMDDLREYKLDFRKLWRSKDSQRIREYIKKEKCFCLQANANYLNLLHSPTYLTKLIYSYLQ
ncbi:MAG: hypothetical protein AMJ95_01205 [Omnitrophica WOR_2 bacterium SM23_72]|nr:MAG: hypothetical protein AMJ95_01205 [Omnitrophica WOR_2 bacterium SM23_72]